MATFKSRTKTEEKTSTNFRSRINPKAYSSLVYSNQSAYDVISDYANRINKGEWLSVEDRAAYKSALDSYVSSGNRLRNFAREYGEGYTPDNEKSWQDSILSMTEGYTNINNFYNQFASDKVYGDWKAENDRYEKYQAMGSNIDPARVESGWKAYLDARHAEKTHEDEEWWETLGRWLGGSGGITDSTLPMYETTETIHDLRDGTEHLRPTADWTDEQRKIFGQLYDESPEKAYAYAGEANYWNNKAKEEEKTKEIQELANKNIFSQGLHSLGAVATSLFGTADALYDLALSNAGRDYSAGQDGTISPFEYSQIVQSSVAEKINADIGTLPEDWWAVGGMGLGDLYSIGMSRAQSLASAAIGGKGATLISFFGQGMASGFDDAKSRGASDGEAALVGLLQGAFEGISEEIGIDRLFKIKDAKTVKALLSNALKQAGTEGLEEGLTSFLNSAVDNFIMQDHSAFAYDVAAYMNQGYTEQEAKSKAWSNATGQIVSDFIGGAISGGLSGGISTGGQTLVQNIKANALYGDQAQSLVRDAVSSPAQEVKALGTKMKTKMDGGKTLSGWDINRLLDATDTPKIKDAISDRLSDLGEKGNIDTITEAITRKLKGVPLTSAEETAYAESSVGKRVFNELRYADKGTHSSAWTESIGARRIGGGYYNQRANVAVKSADGTTANINKVLNVSDEGATVQLSDNTETNVKNLTFNDEKAELVFKTATERVGKVEGWTVEAANVMIKGYEDASDMTPERYIKGWTEAYNLGKAKGATAQLSSMPYASALSNEIRTRAYNIGAVLSESKIVKNTNVGNLSFEDSVTPEMQRSFTKQQRANIDALRIVSKALGVNISVFDSPISEKGKRVGENGSYDPATRTIRIDLHAGNDGRGVMLFTAAHELTHHMREVSRDSFNIFANAVASAIGESDMIGLVNRKLDFLRKNDRLEGLSESQAYDLAFEEVVADSAERMLTDSDALSRLSTELQTKDKNLWQRFKNYIKNLIKKIKAIYNTLAPDSVEANLLKETAENYEDILKIWSDAIVEMAETEDVSGDISAESGDIAFSLRNSEAIEDKSVKYYESHKPDHISREVFNTANEMIQEMVDYMKPYLDITNNNGKRFLPEEIIGNTIFKNGSYGKTIENTTICYRTLAYIDFTNEIKKKIGRPLTVEESFLASQMLYEIAKDPQCLYCYVSLDRKAYDGFLLEYTNQMNSVIDGYNALKTKDKKSIDNLYKEFLNGRKDTKPMKARFNMWVDIAKTGGERITLKDLTTEEIRSEIISRGGALAKQIIDAERYAQSASWAKKLEQYRSYNSEILRMSDSVVKKLNSHYGLRFYSFSEYTAAFIAENMQQIRDASLRGLYGLGYTKEADFPRIFASTGMNINMSVFGKMQNGKVIPDTRQGADWDEVKALRKQYKNVGAVFVATNDELVDWALAQDWIDVVIPFHIVRTGANVAEFYKWVNNTKFQADTDASGKNKTISPTEHHNDLDTFMRLVKERGLTPRFDKWVNDPNYMKLVNETRLSVDESTKLIPKFNLGNAMQSFDEFVGEGGYYGNWYRDGVEFDKAVDIVADDVISGKKANEVDYGRQDLTDEEIAELKKRKGKPRVHNAVKNSDRDSTYLDAVNRGDMETAQRMVDEAAWEAGYRTHSMKDGSPSKVFHGTQAKFTVFSHDAKTVHGKYFGKGFYFTDSENAAEYFAGYGLTYYNPETGDFDLKKESYVMGVYLDMERCMSINAQHFKSMGELRRVVYQAFDKTADYDGLVVYNIKDGTDDLSTVYVIKNPNQVKSADPVTYDDNGNVIPLSERFNPGNSDIRYSDRVTDQKTLDFLENQEHVTVYRAMQVIDGELYPPMAAKVKSDDGKKKLVTPSKIGAWEQAVERPDLIRNGNKFELDKANGSSIQAAYNPYFHTSASPLNDQFSSAYKRPNLVIVEGEIPASELTSGYRAEFAKDTVGETRWHSGPVASKLKGDKARRVFLSRWFKPVRIVPDSEVASIVAKTLEGENIDVPYNVVTPTLRAELEMAGVPIKYQDRESESVSNRSLLANALESATTSQEELDKLREYKKNIEQLNKKTFLLGKMKEDIYELQRSLKIQGKKVSYATFEKQAESKAKSLGFSAKDIKYNKTDNTYSAYVGAREILSADRVKRTVEENTKLAELKEKAAKLERSINYYDRQLVSLESMKPVRDLLQRERAKAYERAAQKGREALHRNVEGRHKTEERHKIQRVIKQLDALLNRGTKDKNVKKGASGLVRAALDLSDMLFATDDELIVNGVGTEYTTAEAAAMDEYVRLYEEYHSYDNSVTEHKERRAFLRSQMTNLKHSFEGVLERERQRINDREAATVYDVLIKEYKKLEKAEEGYLKNAYDKDAAAHIEALKEKLGKTVVGDMTLEQLNDLYKAFKMVKTLVSNSNKLFKAEGNETVEKMGSEALAEIEAKGHKEKFNKVVKKVESFLGWENLKPIYLMERTGSKVLQWLFSKVLGGESVWATDMAEARKYAAEQREAHGYKSWDFEKKVQFTSNTGKTFELNLGQMMTIYAYAKRGEQALEHLRTDGFVYDLTTESKKGMYELNDKTAYKISDEVLLKILGSLSKEQKAYVDAMVKYLSETMGAKGNEVSNVLYGIDLFGEENYFPIRSEGAYLERVREQAKGESKIKNKGYTKPTTPHARNAIVLSDFGKVWSEHVAEMSSYHAFVLPMEDFYRVYNYQTKSDVDADKRGVIPALQNAYSDNATKAIDQLLTDLNGGARGDYREALGKSALSLYKAGKVMASFSVVIQQPSSIVRAGALIDPKFFVGKKIDKKKHKALWEEVKKYAPVAIIKEMGHFDVGMGRASAEWLMAEEYEGIKEKAKALVLDSDYRNDVLSKPASYADEVTWVAIWNAVKRETASKNPKMSTSSEEFLKKAGERFEDIIRRTQVYDSTLSRSGNMRVKSPYTQMLTAFMAEPTTSINMREMALRSGDAKKILRTTAAVYGAALLNSVLVALPYAMRDDDEDETFAEKYITALSSSFLDNVNPLNSLPFVKDVWSIAQGYSIDRMDASMADDLINSLKKIVMVASDEDREDGAIWGAVGDVVLNLSAFTGVPLRNIWRDIKSIINFGKTISRDIEGMETTWMSIGDAMEEMIRNETPILGWLPGESKGDKLYDALVAGDTKYVARFKATYKDESSYLSAVRKALRENDPRMREAAEAYINKDYALYNALRDEIVKEGVFDRKLVTDALKAEINYLKNKEK